MKWVLTRLHLQFVGAKLKGEKCQVKDILKYFRKGTISQLWWRVLYFRAIWNSAAYLAEWKRYAAMLLASDVITLM